MSIMLIPYEMCENKIMSHTCFQKSNSNNTIGYRYVQINEPIKNADTSCAKIIREISKLSFSPPPINRKKVLFLAFDRQDYDSVSSTIS